MATGFSSSYRLANFRQKNSGFQDPLSSNKNIYQVQGQLKLIMPQQQQKNVSYDPTQAFSNTRTSMRLLKGKIQRKQFNDKNEIKSAGLVQAKASTQQRFSIQDSKENMKLVLHDSPQIVQKKALEQVTSKPFQKRIMIAKQPTKQQKVIETPQVQPLKQQQRQQPPAKLKKPQLPKQQPKQQIRQQYVNPHDQKPIIKQEQVQQSKEHPQNQNDLILCPEGCGRKFNRKALEKHAKACKIVFMSKRKQFNSEAKRLTSKQQANIVKQNKLKQKNQFGKAKGFQKTGDNWKVASKDFRSAIKALKKDQQQKDQQANVDNIDGEQIKRQAALNLVPCGYCQKMFAQVLLEKHIENCIKRKQKEKDKKKNGQIKKK